MMGIYIKGEMPIGNDELRLIIHSNGQVFISHQTYFDETEAIPVQPHGRLIDADEISEHKYTTILPHRKKYADGKSKSDDEIIAFKFGWNYAIDAIVENAPTIITAELPKVET